MNNYKLELYDKIINHISKVVKRSINEAFDFGKISNNKREVLHKQYHAAILDSFKDIFIKYFIDMEDNVNEKYRKTLNTELEPVYFNKETSEFYVFPTGYFYKVDRRRKHFELPKHVYYHYIIKANEDNTLTIGIKLNYEHTRYLYLFEPLLRFIENSPWPIKTIYLYHINQNDKFAITRNEEVSECCSIFAGKMPLIKNTEFNKRAIPDGIKLSDLFVENFPEHLDFHALEENYETGKTTSLYKGMFTSIDKFLKVVKAFTDQGFIMIDEDQNVYNKNNMDEYLSDTNKIEDIDIKEDEKTRWLYNHIGEEYINKYLKVKDHIQSIDPYAKKHFYLKKFNGSFRTADAKFSLDTILQLAEVNGIDYKKLCDEFGEDLGFYKDTDDIARFNHKLSTQCLYKMAVKIAEDMPNGWRMNEPDAYDFIHGKEFDNGYMVTHSSMGFNDLNLALDNLVNLYYFFYVMAYGILNFLCTPINFNELGYRVVRNNTNKDVNMETFNFEPAIKVFKTIVDKQIKKFKLK